MDAHEIDPNSQTPLILLTFSLWHLNWLYNTKNKGHHPVSFVFWLTEMRFELQQDLPSRSDRREWVSEEKTPRCGVFSSDGAKVRGFPAKLCLAQKTRHDASGQTSPTPATKKSNSKELDFFICVRWTQHHLRATHATSFERQLNIIAAPRHK